MPRRLAKREETYPVQGEETYGLPPGRIPETVARIAHAAYAAAGHDQSFERLHERGGFGWIELIACLRGDYNRGTGKVEDEIKKIKGIER